MRTFRWILGAAVAAAAIGVADAGYTGNCIEVTASAGGSSSTYAWSVDNMYWDMESQSWEWNLTDPWNFYDDAGRVIGTLSGASVQVKGDPQVNISFSVQAGAADTQFTFTSGLLSFGTIQNPQGLAGAAFTITDTNNDGATLTPQNPSGSSYTAQYNGQAPGGTSFAELINAAFSADPGKSKSVSDNFPANGYSSIGTPVSNMSSQVSFIITAHDLGSGTNNYEIIPEPTTFALLALGVAGLIRRR